MNQHPAAKRFMTALALGVVFAGVCIGLAASGQPDLANPKNPIFWAIVSDRILIGMVVALAGAFTVHPVLGFAYRPWLRGACMGVVVSLPLAAGALAGPGPSPWMIFWATLFAGGFYGAVIDILATRMGGEGAALLSS